MTRSEHAGQPANPAELVDVDELVAAYHDLSPDPAVATQQVSFGTSGHRGSSLSRSFNEAHILAVTQAVCDHRRAEGIDGPLFLGRDTHALSLPAFRTALEVLVANEVTVRIDEHDGYTPTPAISHAILRHNRGGGGGGGTADGIVITPSHNPPEDGGFKYNPPHGGPAGSEVTSRIQDRANALLRDGLEGVRRLAYDDALARSHRYPFTAVYVDDLPTVVEIDAIRDAGIRIGADPLGGASVGYWAAVAARLSLDVTVVDDRVDPTFGFMTRDWDGRIRMDCSSPDAMARLIGARGRFDLAVGNDPDADRHGIVTPSGGLMNPNHYLATAIAYLLEHRPGWPTEGAVGKTLVSSSLIDRVVAGAGRRLYEVPVGFKWFVEGLLDGWLLFGGEESAGASLLRRDGTVWTTDKDGIVLCLLAAELLARTGEDPGRGYGRLTDRYGAPVYTRIDAPATPAQKRALTALSPDRLGTGTVAGGSITAVLTAAPGNGAPIGGVKVITGDGWFAARPSGTEDVYKLYAESFLGPDHLAAIVADAQAVIANALSRVG